MSMNIIVPNNTPIGVEQFYPVWKLTRAMKAAGWKYLGSSTGVSGDGKEITGNPVLDLWGPGGVVDGGIQLGSQTGSGAAIAASPTSKNITVTGLTGMTTASVGNGLTISGAISSEYNGTFTIVEYLSATSVKIYVGAENSTNSTAESSLTWSERISGTSSITWSDLANGREQTITGLSGMTTSSPGHYIKLSGSSNSNNNGVFNILSYVSASSVIIINNSASAATDTASGEWVELDPLLDQYPENRTSASFGLGAWLLFQGPSTLKIPINAASTGTFIKGEIITEDTSDAKGELLGYQYEPTLSYGYLVVMPLSDGYGAGVKGWDTAATIITGSASGATVTTAGPHTPIEYINEVCFGRRNISGGEQYGHIFNQCADSVSESTLRLSYLMTNASGCTFEVMPGDGGTDNLFPSVNSFFAKKNAYWFNYSSTAVFGKFQIMVADAEYKSTQSADGSFTLAVGYGVVDPGCTIGFGYYRCDNSEDGDVDPYVWFMPTSGTSYTDTKQSTTAGSPPSSTNNNFSASAHTSLKTPFKGFRRRGFSTYDDYQAFFPACLASMGSSGANVLYNYSVQNDSIATSLSPNTVKVREPIWIISDQTIQILEGLSYGKMRKGTLRWLYIVQGGSGGDTYDNKQWIQLSSAQGPWIAGPWDGVTNPLFS